MISITSEFSLIAEPEPVVVAAFNHNVFMTRRSYLNVDSKHITSFLSYHPNSTAQLEAWIDEVSRLKGISK